MTDKQVNTCEFLNICQTNCDGILRRNKTMMDELIKTFFDTFGIEPIRSKRNVDDNAMLMNKVYPQITDHILLELICILGNISYFLITDEGSPIDMYGLKKSVLHSLTLQAKSGKNKYLKQQVRTLFKEG